MWLEGRCERTRFYWINSVWFLLLSPWLRSWVGVDSWMVWICFLVLWLGSSEAFMPWHTRPSAVCLGNCGYKRSVMLFPAHQLTGHTRHWRGQKCPSEWILLKLGGRLFAAYSQIIYIFHYFPRHICTFTQAGMPGNWIKGFELISYLMFTLNCYLFTPVWWCSLKLCCFFFVFVFLQKIMQDFNNAIIMLV